MRLIVATSAMLAFALPTSAVAQVSAQTTANASVELKAPLSLVCDKTMQFGDLVSPAAQSTVVMPANGQPLVDNSGIVLPGIRDFATPASCIASGAAGYNFIVTLPSSPVLLSYNSHTMSLGTFTIEAELDGDPYKRLLGPSGSHSFGIGATLTVNANQAPGLYTGTFPVSVVYE